MEFIQLSNWIRNKRKAVKRRLKPKHNSNNLLLNNFFRIEKNPNELQIVDLTKKNRVV
jgi:hypothetical protein